MASPPPPGNEDGKVAKPSVSAGAMDLRSILLRVRKNAGFLIGSTSVTTLTGLAQVALNARALGPQGLGMLALVQAYVEVLDRIFDFDTWQPLINFGSQAIKDEDYGKLRDVVALAILFDVSAALASGVVALVLLAFARAFTAIDPVFIGYAAIFSGGLFLRVNGAPIGVMRLLDRFSVIAAVQSAMGLFRLAVIATLFVLKAPLLHYVVAYTGFMITTNLAMFVAAMVVFHRRGLPPLLQAKFADLRGLFREFGKFSVSTSAMATINGLRRRVDVFLLGALAGTEAVGLYAVVQRIYTAGSKFADVFAQVTYPEVVSLAKREEFGQLGRLLRRLSGFGLAAGAAAVIGSILFAPWGLEVIAGKAFREAAGPLHWLMAAFAIYLAAFWMRAVVLSTLGPLFYLRAFIIASIALVVVAPAAIWFYGPSGAGISQVVFNVVSLGISGWGVVHYLRQKRAEALR
jgi:O-antigen/teichoic acid export membrane protein